MQLTFGNKEDGLVTLSRPPGTDGMTPDGELPVRVVVELPHLSTDLSTRVSIEMWSRFLTGLRGMGLTKRGQATVHSVTPGEMELSVYSVGFLGHIALKGTFRRTGDSPQSMVSFSGLSVDDARSVRTLVNLRRFARGPWRRARYKGLVLVANGG